MKKNLVILLVALIGFGFAANAQSCVISGTNNSTVQVQDSYVSGKGPAVVVVSNDDNVNAANVTVTIEVTYSCFVPGNSGLGRSSYTKTFTGSRRAAALSNTEIRIPLGTWTKGSYTCDEPISVRVISISGQKCQ